MRQTKAHFIICDIDKTPERMACARHGMEES